MGTGTKRSLYFPNRPNEFTSSSVTTRMGERFVSLRSTSQNSEMATSNVAEQRVANFQRVVRSMSSTIREALLGWDCGRE